VKNALVIILHAHIPYVLGHGVWPHGEDWLYESAAESYLPLLRIFSELAADGRSPKVTLVVTPILAEQLCDERFKGRFKDYLRNKIAAAEQDESNFARDGDTHMAGLAHMWRQQCGELLREFTEAYHEDIVGALGSLERRGAIEIMTSAATHGYLPLLGEDGAIRAQLRVAVETHKRRFGVAPRGLWLPECAYQPRQEWTSPIGDWGPARVRPGTEEFLADEGIRYFVVDSHLVQGGAPVAVYHRRFGEVSSELRDTIVPPAAQRSHGPIRSPYSVYYVAPPGSELKVAFFTRDPKTGLQVWSGTSGYPADANYLEFHKRRFPGGHRYWRVTDCTGGLENKEPYVPDEARATAMKHADHFIGLVGDTVCQPAVDVVTAPYDAELFGHWWFEGPQWLKRVLGLAHDHPDIEPTTPTEYLDTHRPVDVVQLPEGSWGFGGAHAVWFNSDTRWTWVRIYDAEIKMRELARTVSTSTSADVKQVLQQMARELLLLESSDWQFNISTWSARDYAERRLEEHYAAFEDLHRIAYRCMSTGTLSDRDRETVTRLGQKDSPFEVVEPQWWC
jgi:1,4-alpha-glucan branching enzyme